MKEGKPSNDTRQICLVSQKEAAEMLQISERSVRNAKAVREHGSPELIEMVEQGKVAVSKAAKSRGGNVSTSDHAKSRDAIGARVGVSGRTYEKFEQYRRGVQLLRDKGHLGAITKEQARKAAVEDAKANPLSKNGNGTGEDNSRNKNRVDNVKPVKGGNDTTYTLRRLARDAPEVLDKVESGELSVNQAAIQAGI